MIKSVIGDNISFGNHVGVFEDLLTQPEPFLVTFNQEFHHIIDEWNSSRMFSQSVKVKNCYVEVSTSIQQDLYNIISMSLFMNHF